MKLSEPEKGEIEKLFKAGYSKEFIYHNLHDTTNVNRSDVRNYMANVLERNGHILGERYANMKLVKEKSKEYRKEYGKDASYVKDREAGLLYEETGDYDYLEELLLSGGSL